MLRYSDSATGVQSDQLTGFFVGWPNAPTAERHLDILRGSDAAVLTIDDGAVVGYTTAISDGVLSAFISSRFGRRISTGASRPSS